MKFVYLNCNPEIGPSRSGLSDIGFWWKKTVLPVPRVFCTRDKSAVTCVLYTSRMKKGRRFWTFSRGSYFQRQAFNYRKIKNPRHCKHLFIKLPSQSIIPKIDQFLLAGHDLSPLGFTNHKTILRGFLMKKWIFCVLLWPFYWSEVSNAWNRFPYSCIVRSHDETQKV